MNEEMIERMAEQVKPGQVYAIIPARGGSKGVPNKNIRCLRGYPLIAYSIAAARLCPEIDRTIVTTDSEQYAQIARRYGAETPFLRPAEFASDRSTDIEFMQHAIRWLSENEGSLPEYFVHLRPTYPLREVSVVSEAVRTMQRDAAATSLRSAYLLPEKPYKWFNLRDDGYFKCLFEGLTPDEANNPRQGFPNVYVPDGYVDVLRTTFIVKSGLMHGERVIGFVTPDGVDIDEMKDYEKVERYIQEHELALYRYLHENYAPMEDGNA